MKRIWVFLPFVLWGFAAQAAVLGTGTAYGPAEGTAVDVLNDTTNGTGLNLLVSMSTTGAVTTALSATSGVIGVATNWDSAIVATASCSISTTTITCSGPVGTLATGQLVNGSGVTSGTTITGSVTSNCSGGCTISTSQTVSPAVPMNFSSGKAGYALVQETGKAPLTMDGTPTIGDYVIPSTSTQGQGHDAGASCAPGTIGVVDSLASGSIWFVKLTGGQCGGQGTLAFTTYTGHGTYTLNKPAGTNVTFACIGAGASGGSGNTASSGNVSAGAGGGGGAFNMATLPISSITWPVTVTVGTGGTAVAGSTAATGTHGNAGTSTTFTNGGTTYLTCWGANAGSNNISSNGTCMADGTATATGTTCSSAFIFGTGQVGGTGNTSQNIGNSATWNGPGGGSGGGVPSSAVNENGGAGGISPGATTGGTAGTAPSGNGGTGNNPALLRGPGFLAGSGGGGGANCFSAACTAGSGNTGGYGAGGGGGGGCQSAACTSGGSGAGGDGVAAAWGS